MPAACAWGKNNESKAKDAYVTKMQTNGHNNLQVSESGLVINTEYTFLGASPDDLVHDPVSADANGLLEMKCPYLLKDISPYEAAQQMSFFCYLQDGSLHLKKQHHYYYQVQGQMAICSKKWCDFVVYTNNGISIERIQFDELVWNAMILKLKSFYINSLLPKLVQQFTQ